MKCALTCSLSARCLITAFVTFPLHLIGSGLGARTTRWISMSRGKIEYFGFLYSFFLDPLIASDTAILKGPCKALVLSGH